MSSEESKLEDIVEFLRAAIKLERAAATLYRSILSRFVCGEEVTALLRKVAAEEDSHANFLSGVFKVVEKAPEAFGKLQVEVSEVESNLAFVESLIDDIVSGSVTLTEAVSMALKLETGLSESSYFGFFTEVKSGGLKGVLEEILVDTEGHAKILEDIEDILRKEDLKKVPQPT